MKFDINHVVDNILTEHEDPYVGYQMSGQGTTESAEKFFNREWRCCQDYGQVFSTPQGAATPKNFQNPDFGLKWRDFWVFL